MGAATPAPLDLSTLVEGSGWDRVEGWRFMRLSDTAIEQWRCMGRLTSKPIGGEIDRRG